MRIGYDAKRAFFNQSGLGNYSRNLLNSLFARFPENKYLLYTPGINPVLFNPPVNITDIKLPKTTFHKTFPSYRRSFALSHEIKEDQPDIYHGLSHELPFGIKKSGVKSVVTIHDLIFFRYPKLYKPVDRLIYKKKFGYACKHATCVVAVSKQTADDISDFLNVSPDKIEVIYQGYNSVFEKKINTEEKESLRKKYSLPLNFILYVGTIEERKNLLNLIQAVHTGKIHMPVVAIGRKTSYFEKIKNYIEKHHLKGIHFIDTVKNDELPGFYQMADVFVYPSFFEGFGIPILESVVSGTPVITSKGSCFAEAGGEGALYVDPKNTEELANAIQTVLTDNSKKWSLVQGGEEHAMKFTGEKIAENMMALYTKILNK